METLKKLETQILELMGLHNCVTVPGLGSFIYRDSSASSNNFTFELKPATGTLFFNNAITADDGILVNAVREKEGLTYSQALSQVQSAAESLKAALQEKRNFAFGKLGNFFLNADHQIFFLPSSHLNLSHTSYGLPFIKLDELEKKPESAPVTTLRTEKVQEIKAAPINREYEEAEVLHVEEDDNRRNPGWLWKAASVAAIAILGATGIYYGSSYLNRDTKSNTAEVAPVSGSSQPAEVQTAPESTTIATPPVTETIVEKPEQVVEEVETPAAIMASADFWSVLKAKPGKYFVIGGMYMDLHLAELEVSQWNQNGVSAAIYKPSGSSLYKVVFGRFESEKEASALASDLPVYNGASVSVREMKIKE